MEKSQKCMTENFLSKGAGEKIVILFFNVAVIYNKSIFLHTKELGGAPGPRDPHSENGWIYCSIFLSLE